MADDLSDAFKEIRALQKDVRRLQNARPLENASVTQGRLRFIGGLLLIDSGGTLQIVGQLIGNGEFRWTGPWRLEGPGTITGTVTQTGNTTQQGSVTLTGGGKVTAGNVTVEPNRVTVGSAWLENGELVLSNGAKVAVGLTGGTSSIGLVPGGSADISVNTLTAWLRATGAAISVTTAQARIAAPTIILDSLPTGAPSGAKAVLVDPSNGKLYRAA